MLHLIYQIYFIIIMDFQTFITKYSFVNAHFVKDFYNIIKEDYIERSNEFLIDSEILRKWLQISTRQIFNNTIKRSYKKNVDLEMLDPTGVVVEKWILEGCFLTSFDGGSLGYDSDKIATVSVNLRMDRCILVY
mgnify:CR=1 FL=1